MRLSLGQRERPEVLSLKGKMPVSGNKRDCYCLGSIAWSLWAVEVVRENGCPKA